MVPEVRILWLVGLREDAVARGRALSAVGRVRLIPLGQTDGLRIVAALEPVIARTANRVLGASLDDLGGASFRADIAGMRHETQHTRLFRR